LYHEINGLKTFGYRTIIGGR